MFQFLCADIPHCIQAVMISFFKCVFANSWIKNCAWNLLGLGVLHTVMQSKTEFALISCVFEVFPRKSMQLLAVGSGRYLVSGVYLTFVCINYI